MADRYVAEQVGVSDGTKIPADQADGRVVDGIKRSIIGTKVTGVAWAIADRIMLGTVPAGRKVVGIRCTTDTSFATATLSIGNSTTANKYVNAATLTATNVPTMLGPQATAMDDAPLSAEEDIWLTVGVAAIAAGTIATFEIETVGI